MRFMWTRLLVYADVSRTRATLEGMNRFNHNGVCVCVCVYVCMYLCMYVCLYVCMYLCMYVCVCVCMYFYIYVYILVCVCVYTCVCVRASKYHPLSYSLLQIAKHCISLLHIILLSQYLALIGWFLQWRRHVFSVRYLSHLLHAIWTFRCLFVSLCARDADN
jgi:hypothetical protein